jgi:hypothetical protein
MDLTDIDSVYTVNFEDYMIENQQTGGALNPMD